MPPPAQSVPVTAAATMVPVSSKVLAVPWARFDPVLPTTVDAVIDAEPVEPVPMPPPRFVPPVAVLPETVLLVMVRVAFTWMPPPSLAVLPEMVVSMTCSGPGWTMPPPPLVVVLPVTVTRSSTVKPARRMPPPGPVARHR